MKKTILLFGGSGMLGREFLNALTDYRVVAPSRASVDITDKIAVDRIVVESRPDFIINAAAIIDVNAIEEQPEIAKGVNVDGAGFIAQAAALHNVPQLFMSSSYVFSNSDTNYNESDIPNPANAYGKTKMDAENSIVSCGSNAPWYIIRTSWLYSIYRNTFVDEVVVSLKQHKTFEASSQRGNLTYSEDLVESIVKNFINSTLESGIYHVINEGSASRQEIAYEIADILSAPKHLIVEHDHSSKKKRPSVCLVNTKIPPLPPWRESLRKYILRNKNSN